MFSNMDETNNVVYIYIPFGVIVAEIDAGHFDPTLHDPWNLIFLF